VDSNTETKVEARLRSVSEKESMALYGYAMLEGATPVLSSLRKPASVDRAQTSITLV
jgi:hypothetical protein